MGVLVSSLVGQYEHVGNTFCAWKCENPVQVVGFGFVVLAAQFWNEKTV